MCLKKLIRSCAFLVVTAIPLFLQTGCSSDGNGGGQDGAGAQLPAEEDSALNPETDSTMQVK